MSEFVTANKSRTVTAHGIFNTNRAMAEAKRVYLNKDEEYLQNEINGSMDYFLSKIKPIIFDMWDYYFRAFCDNPLDYNTYERIL